MQHKTNAYKDGFSWVVYCECCGEENPTGDCSGKYVSPFQAKEADNKVVNNVSAVDKVSELK